MKLAKKKLAMMAHAGAGDKEKEQKREHSHTGLQNGGRAATIIGVAYTTVGGTTHWQQRNKHITLVTNATVAEHPRQVYPCTNMYFYCDYIIIISVAFIEINKIGYS